MSPSAVTENGQNQHLTDTAVAKNLAKANHELISDDMAIKKTNGTSHAGLDASLLTTNLATNLPAEVDYTKLDATSCSDHMIISQWKATSGWSAPELKPFGPLSIMPNASVLHYATECFEGMKLYRGYDNKLRLFRPDRNMKRMLVSASRIALPAFEPEELLKLIKKLCATDGPRWLPKDSAKGKFMYIRPTMIGDWPSLGVAKPGSALLYVLLSRFPNMDKPTGLRLMASNEDTIRAHEGGWGYAKVGANYGPSLMAQAEASSRGYDQVLWLLPNKDGEKKYMEVTEAGASNFFLVLKTKEGKTELVTAPIEQKVILDGVTRRSVLDLAAERLTKGSSTELEPLTISERKIDMQEIVDAEKEGRIVEAFTSGTAYFVTPVSIIFYKGEDIKIPMVKGHTGAYAEAIKTWLSNIMYGKEGHAWGVEVDEA
jgi:branched-chain amino acid aminotransferase